MKCKLTDQNIQTHGGFQWVVGEWAETSGNGDLCSSGWLHYYDDPLVAVMMNPMHADIGDPRCWEIEIDGEQKHDNGLKSGATRLRLVREIDLPEITNTQRVAFGILCAMEVSNDPAWTQWAKAWLSGEDRSEAAAWAAKTEAAREAWARAAATEEAARAAARAAKTEAARAAAWAAEWAAEAARAKPLDLIAIATKAMEY